MKPIILATAIALTMTGCKTTAELRSERMELKAAESTATRAEKAARERVEQSILVEAMKKPDSIAAVAAIMGHYMTRQTEAVTAAFRAEQVEPVVEGWDDKLLRFALGTLQVAAPIAGNVVLGLDAGKTQRQASNNALIAQQADSKARVDTVTAVTSGMNALGSAGFASVERVAVAGAGAIGAVAAKPTSVITVTGNHNAVAAVSSTATTSKECTTGSTSPGGNGSTAGNTGTGGNGASGSSTAETSPATGGTGAPSGNSIPAASGGQSGPTGGVSC